MIKISQSYAFVNENENWWENIGWAPILAEICATIQEQ